ncbi:MAG: glycosyltransferase family 2 protein [Lachnospiraceae bacterium]|nr:glycosyltransferase family 2 protein [Lachnospiraceae bacterium]
MSLVTVVIPNLNGMKYLKGCLDALRAQTLQDFQTILIDNGSRDQSSSFVRTNYPEVTVVEFDHNTGFCEAVNTGIKMARGKYVVLLNNDTRACPSFLKELTEGMERHPGAFSCASMMLRMDTPDLIDDAGDYYCALGWAFAMGKGKRKEQFSKERKIFASCGGASIYRRDLLLSLGLFDEAHFAYLEDIDIGYRARIAGYENWYIPAAQVLHAGSASSGSAYNLFKIRHASKNSILLVYKNMPAGQIILNAPLLLAGFLIKVLFFARMGFGKEYLHGLIRGIGSLDPDKKVRFRMKNLRYYIQIQLELWANLARRIQSA